MALTGNMSKSIRILCRVLLSCLIRNNVYALEAFTFLSILYLHAVVVLFRNGGSNKIARARAKKKILKSNRMKSQSHEMLFVSPGCNHMTTGYCSCCARLLVFVVCFCFGRSIFSFRLFRPKTSMEQNGYLFVQDPFLDNEDTYLLESIFVLPGPYYDFQQLLLLLVISIYSFVWWIKQMKFNRINP